MTKYGFLGLGIMGNAMAANDLYFGKDGVLEGISAGKSYIDVSTVDAGTSTHIHDAVVKKGGRFLEAPVSGSKKQAQDGLLIFFALVMSPCLEMLKMHWRSWAKKHATSRRWGRAHR